MLHTHTCAIRIKISVLCVPYLHSILIAKKCTQSQLVPRCKGVRKEPNERTEERTNLCAIKRQNTARDGGGQQRQRLRANGRAVERQSGRAGQSKFTFAVKRQRRCVFNIFQRVLPFHVVSSSLSARPQAKDRERQREREQVEWSILFLRERGGERGHECAVRSTTN